MPAPAPLGHTLGDGSASDREPLSASLSLPCQSHRGQFSCQEDHGHGQSHHRRPELWQPPSTRPRGHLEPKAGGLLSLFPSLGEGPFLRVLSGLHHGQETKGI